MIAVKLTAWFDPETQAELAAQTADSFSRQVIGLGLAGVEAAMSACPADEEAETEPAD